MNRIAYCLILLLGIVACSTVSELSKEEVQDLEVHNTEVQEKIENPNSADEIPKMAERVWRAPNYSGQKDILGYNDSVFMTPVPLKERVQFWVDIFTKYSTSQGVLHDSRYVNIVYESLDFTSLDTDKHLSYRSRFKAEQKIINEKKKRIIAILEKLQKTDADQVSTLNEEELRFWKMFEGVDEPNKFIAASEKGRLRFQLGQSDRFKLGIFYSGRYMEEMERIFALYNLPKELTRIPFVESSFNIKARSKVGASGIWQFMRGAGKEYMKVNNIVDERNDPLTATHAAAKKLKSNYQILKSWPLAITAYNHGVYGMKRIVDKYQSTELFDYIGKKPTSRFGFASESFYATFLAAVEVEKNAEKYFGKAPWDKEFKFEEVTLDRALAFKDLKLFFGKEDAAAYNLQLSASVVKGYVHIPAKTKIKIPADQKEAFAAFLSQKTSVHSVSTDANSDKFIKYEVASGDTLSGISKQFQISQGKIIQVNEDINPSQIRPGQVLLIPQ